MVIISVATRVIDVLLLVSRNSIKNIINSYDYVRLMCLYILHILLVEYRNSIGNLWHLMASHY